MKTKQEQIEKMMFDVPQTIVAYDANPKGQHLYGEQRLQIAEILYDKGYGKVSEYKAEIERLKADNEALTMWDEAYTEENEKLKAENKVLKDGIVKAFTNGFNTGREQVEKDIRRAKINAMIELKEKIVEHMGEREYMGVKYKQGVFSESEIDEFIKEAQDAEDKG